MIEYVKCPICGHNMMSDTLSRRVSCTKCSVDYEKTEDHKGVTDDAKSLCLGTPINLKDYIWRS